jgi:hypothetical protein
MALLRAGDTLAAVAQIKIAPSVRGLKSPRPHRAP